LFWVEAAKNNVLPLDASVATRVVIPKPSLAAGRSTFVYSGELTGIPPGGAPSVLNLPEPKKAAVLSDRGCNLGRQLFGGRGCWRPASNNVHAAFMAPLLTWLLGQELWNPTGSIGIVRSRE